MKKSSNYIDKLNPLPHFELKLLLRFIEQGFQFEVAQRIVSECLVDQTFSSERIRIAHHPRGWAILATDRIIPGWFFDSKADAIDRARSNAQCLECGIDIYDEEGNLEQHVSDCRNY